MIYDSAVIGTGPAGLSAALNLKIRGKNFIWIGSRMLSDKISKAPHISNYPGFCNASGEELAEAFRRHAEEAGLQITDRMVTSVVPFSGHYALMAGSDFYETKTVILASGTEEGAMLPGEAEFLGKGVSYCAVCDGNLYRGRTIAVLCGNARFEDETAFLAALAEKVYFFPTYRNVSLHAENMKEPGSALAEIIGTDRVCAVKLKNGSVLETDGVFCLRESVAASALMPELKTRSGQIAVDRSMATNLPGIYAAGDCTGRPYQYAKAVGEGNVAAHSVLEYLAEHGSESG